MERTSRGLVPFEITICGIEKLGDHCAVGVNHVLSILDPAAPEPPAFGSFGEHERRELRFDDVIEESPVHVVPRRQHVENILSFGRDLGDAPLTSTHLLVHCHMGVSRSTAAMTLILAQTHPELSGDEIVNEVMRIRDRGWSNLRVVEIGDGLLGRDDTIVAPLRGVYLEQLQKCPQLEHRELWMLRQEMA